jgi:four helix bundle protein
MSLVKLIYRLTGNFPKSELFGLTSQMRRAAVSIPSNIAEGKQRRGINEYVHFLSIAFGSTAELETQLLIVKDIYSEQNDLCEAAIIDVIEIQKMLTVLIYRLKPNT